MPRMALISRRDFPARRSPIAWVRRVAYLLEFIFEWYGWGVTLYERKRSPAVSGNPAHLGHECRLWSGCPAMARYLVGPDSRGRRPAPAEAGREPSSGPPGLRDYPRTSRCRPDRRAARLVLAVRPERPPHPL